MDTTSLWQKISKTKNAYPSLAQELEVDVAIVGGGITGMTAAYHLTNAGKKVAVLDAHQIGGITTSSSTGNLYIAVQPHYQNIISKFNVETAKAIAKSRQFAIDFIEQIVSEKKISCSFSRRPWFLYTNDKDKIEMLQKEVEAFRSMGFTIEYTENLPLAFPFKKAVVMENQARFNPLEYVRHLANDLSKQGCEIFENTTITHLEEEDYCTLQTSTGHVIRAGKTIMATHTPLGINNTQFFTAPYRSYVVAVKLKNNHYPEGHFWGMDTTHYVTSTHAIDKDQPQVLLVSGSHHKVGQEKDAAEHFKKLESFLYDHFPVEEISYHWSAQHFQAADDIPYIGLATEDVKHTYMATGFFADGLVYGTLAGTLMSDLILERENPWAHLYTTDRLNLRASVGFLLKENLNYLAQYYKDFPESEIKDFSDLKPGEATVVEMDREKWGVYKDEEEKLHIVSAVCTHMKCIVHWNNAEKTWDCPCHGSRFTKDGEVLEGPAQINLKKKG